MEIVAPAFQSLECTRRRSEPPRPWGAICNERFPFNSRGAAADPPKKRSGVDSSIKPVSLFFVKTHEIRLPAAMVLDSKVEERFRSHRFDGTLLELGPEEEAFFKVETGIQNPEELRKHIIDVHEEAYEVCAPLLARWPSVTQR